MPCANFCTNHLLVAGRDIAEKTKEVQLYLLLLSTFYLQPFNFLASPVLDKPVV